MGAFDKYQRAGLQHEPRPEAEKGQDTPPRPTDPEAPSQFETDLTMLINRYSKENESGTPDHILAAYLSGCLELFNTSVRMRSHWRGESVELPALQKISQELRKKKVPLVIYTDGRRNEIGEAEVEQWPGEVRVSGTITGVVPMFATETHGDYSIG